MEEKIRKPQGFAAMDVEKRKEVARKGGLAVQNGKRSFSTNPELAREAGRKGGLNVPKEKRGFAVNRQSASDAGRKGGAQAALNRKKALANGPV